MAAANRISTTHIASKVMAEAHNYAFFQLVEFLHKLNDKSLEYNQDLSPVDEIIKFTGTGSIGFPASDITDAGVDEFDGRSLHRIETSFFGMHGSSSPLPGHFLDIVAWEFAQKEGIRYHFLDFFNHRLTTLLHRAWRKYRYYIRYMPGGNDRFSQHLYALIGAHDPEMRKSSRIHWSSLLKFSGIIASQQRSAHAVSQILKHYFNLPQVEIHEWVKRKVEIPADQLSQLGQQNFSLGQSLVAGTQVPTVMGKFVIAITNLKHARFVEFLPNGKRYPELIELLEFLLRDQQAYDLELGLHPEEVPPFQLQSKNEQPVFLGWSSVLGQGQADTQTRLTITVRS